MCFFLMQQLSVWASHISRAPVSGGYPIRSSRANIFFFPMFYRPLDGIQELTLTNFGSEGHIVPILFRKGSRQCDDYPGKLA